MCIYIYIPTFQKIERILLKQHPSSVPAYLVSSAHLKWECTSGASSKSMAPNLMGINLLILKCQGTIGCTPKSVPMVFIGISHRGTLVGVHPTIPWKWWICWFYDHFNRCNDLLDLSCMSVDSKWWFSWLILISSDAFVGKSQDHKGGSLILYQIPPVTDAIFSSRDGWTPAQDCWG